MTNKIICPECEKYVPATSDKCKCGWYPRHQVNTAPADYRCEYTNGERRCPLPGSICAYPYSTKGPWHCSLHWRTLGDPQLAEAALREAEENYGTIMEEHRDWRAKLFTQERR